MGTEVYSKSQVPGFYSMRDINEDSNSSGWFPFYGDNNLLNGQYYNGFMPRAVTDGYPEYEKNALKQKILEHEAIFKNQVCELHRVYRVQRDMMEEVGSKGLRKRHISIDASSSSSHLPSQIPSDEARNGYIPSFPLANSGYVRQPILGSDVTDSPLSCTKRNGSQAGYVSCHNKCTSKDNVFSNSRPSKVRKKLFDLQLPADEYIDTEEEQFPKSRISDFSSYPPNGGHIFAAENYINLFLRGEKTSFHKETSSSCLKSAHGLADLNDPIQIKEDTPPICDDFRGRSACHGKIGGLDFSKPAPQFIDLTQEYSQNSHHGSSSGDLKKFSASNEGIRRGWLSCNYMYEGGNKGRNSHSISKFLQSEQFPLSSHPISFMRDKSHQHSGIFPTDRREESWIEKSRTYEVTGSSRDSNYNHPDSIMASHISSSNVYSSDMANLWLQSATSLGQPNACLSQKLTSVSRHPHCISSDTLSRTSQPSAQTHETFGDKWHGNGSSRLTPGLGGDLPVGNGFFQRSPLGSKEKLVSRSPFYISSETLSRNSQPSAQTHDIFGDKWHANGNSRLSPGLASDLPIGNGSYNGTPSGSKAFLGHLPLIGKDNLNCSKLDMLGSERFSNSGSNYPNKRSDVMDLKSGRDLDLNVVLPETAPNEADTQQHLDILGKKSKCYDHIATWPWLREKPVCKSAASVTRKDLNLVEPGSLQASSNEFLKNGTANETNLLFSQNVTSASNGHNVVSKKDLDDSLGNKKILGYPVGKTYTSKNDSSSLMSTSESTKNEGYRGIDINVAYESVNAEFGDEIRAEALVVEKGVDTTFKILRNIDLNSCISEDEGLLGSSLTSTTSTKGKILLEIDLEALPSCESEEILHEEEPNQHDTTLQTPQHKAEDLGDEVTRLAAEAIVAISSIGLDHPCCNYLNPSETSLPDSLLWFAEVVSSTPDDTESILYNRSKGRDCGETETCKELDDFETMTLQLKDTREEDYILTPFVPEFQEELGTSSLPGRPRRGQARRGRQKRDFQRDILPGLITLSRHEVTEDLQTFGSLMRATGHQWNGLTRRSGTRSGAARGRKRRVADPTLSVVVTPVCTPLMPQPNSVEVGLEDRSLTGWGQITRRPRRQRCAAGNNVVA